MGSKFHTVNLLFPFLSFSYVGGREENGAGNKQTVIVMEGPSCCRDQCGCASQLPGKSRVWDLERH